MLWPPSSYIILDIDTDWQLQTRFMINVMISIFQLLISQHDHYRTLTFLSKYVNLIYVQTMLDSVSRCMFLKRTDLKVMRENDWNQCYITFTITITNRLTDNLRRSLHSIVVYILSLDLKKVVRLVIWHLVSYSRLFNFWLSEDSLGEWCIHRRRRFHRQLNRSRSFLIPLVWFLDYPYFNR